MAAGSPINRNAAIHAESVRWAVEEALPTANAVLGKVNNGELEVFIGSNVCLSFYVILVPGIGPQTVNRGGGRRCR
jgi:hypothetical protein